MGRLNVDAMLSEMTASEFAEWQAFDSLEPLGADAEDIRAGVIAATIANYAGKMLKEGEVKTPADFFPSLAGPSEKPKQNPAAAKSRAAMMALAARKRA